SSRAKYVQGLIASLQEVDDRDNKAYVISLLQKAGKDDAVSALSAYLQDEYLAGKAARALATIGTSAASNALLTALPSAKGHAQISIVEALGDTGYADAESSILSLAGTGDLNLQKVILYALANIAGTSSADVLKKAAQDAGYVYD